MAHGARTGAATPAPGPAAVPGGPDRRLTVCVIGAGAAGLTVAHELDRLNHRTVVLESEPEVGGKSASIHVDGRAYDLGAHICTPQYAELVRLAAELGVDTEDATPSRVHDTGGTTPRIPDPAFFRPEAFARYARLRAERFPRIDRPGLAHSARELAVPVAEWLRGNGLDDMAASLGDGYTASGYGHLRGDLPALYFVKYAEMTGLFSTRRQLAGHAGTFTVRDGFARLWRRVADALPDVRTGVRIESVERTGQGVTVRTSGGTVHADALVVTPSPDRVAHLLDATAEERDIAARIRTVDYYTVVCRISGLFREGFYLASEHTAAAAEPGHCVAYHHRYADSDVYTCYLYGADGLDHTNVGARLGEDVARMGGRVEEVLLVRRWPFMPHFSSADLAAGVLDRVENLQGRNRTYYAGGLLGYELIETTVAYSRDLVGRFFSAGPDGAGTGPVPAGEVDTAEATRPAAAPDSVEILEWLLKRIAAETGESVDPHAPLDDYLMDSLAVAEVQGQLSEWLGFRVSPTLLLELPTADAVARHLAGLLGESQPAPPGQALR
ncbi:FAD-dependent oxidoreductase [Marinactinospora rubrisoli]|uniref:FAD-dependent oxidoreductase n=1 Tax=Marinactinospora rubrisoli TaxID=2715399 RepID=A0ABW2KJ28_9ACTN